MHYIIVSDIFGKTPQLCRFAQALKAPFSLIDPYDGVVQAIDNEQQAYRNFLNKVGHEKYTEKVAESFNQISTATVCIAFSAGASAAWRAQLFTADQPLLKLFGFYPSQIRHFLHLSAKIPCEFIFPTQEPHFDVASVAAILEQKRNISCRHCHSGHGFMNPLSANFDASSYSQYLSYLQQQSY